MGICIYGQQCLLNTNGVQSELYSIMCTCVLQGCHVSGKSQGKNKIFSRSGKCQGILKKMSGNFGHLTNVRELSGNFEPTQMWQPWFWFHRIFFFLIDKWYMTKLVTSCYLVVEFFTNSPQYKNANIADFVLALPFKINWSNELCNLETKSLPTSWFLILHILSLVGAIKEENCNFVGIQSWQ